MNLYNGSHNLKAKDPLFSRQENRAFPSLPNQINGVQTTGPQGCRCRSPSRGRAGVGQGRPSLQWDKMGRWEEKVTVRWLHAQVAQEEVTQSPRGSGAEGRLRTDRPREAGPHLPLLVTLQSPPTPNKFQPNFRASSGDSFNSCSFASPSPGASSLLPAWHTGNSWIPTVSEHNSGCSLG